MQNIVNIDEVNLALMINIECSAHIYCIKKIRH
jgi:hypothetical protein